MVVNLSKSNSIFAYSIAVEIGIAFHFFYRGQFMNIGRFLGIIYKFFYSFLQHGIYFLLQRLCKSFVKLNNQPSSIILSISSLETYSLVSSSSIIWPKIKSSLSSVFSAVTLTPSLFANSIKSWVFLSKESSMSRIAMSLNLLQIYHLYA